MELLSSPSAAVAVCPEHPERESIAPCERCGRFLCEACLASRTPPRCPACEAKARDPLGVLAQPFSLGGALRHGWKLFSLCLLQIAPIALLTGILGGLLTYAIESNDGSLRASLRFENFFSSTIGLIPIGAYLALMVGAAEGTPRGVGAALLEGLRAWPRLFGARFRGGLWILLYALLLIVPGIIKAVSLAVVTEAAYREPQTDALESSTQLTQGRRWEVFGLFVTCYLFTFLAVGLMSVVGGVLAAVLPDTGPLFDILIDTILRLSEAFACGVGLAAFYGLKRSQGRELEPLRAP